MSTIANVHQYSKCLTWYFNGLSRTDAKELSCDNKLNLLSQIIELSPDIVVLGNVDFSDKEILFHVVKEISEKIHNVKMALHIAGIATELDHQYLKKYINYIQLSLSCFIISNNYDLNKIRKMCQNEKLPSIATYCLDDFFLKEANAIAKLAVDLKITRFNLIQPSFSNSIATRSIIFELLGEMQKNNSNIYFHFIMPEKYFLRQKSEFNGVSDIFIDSNGDTGVSYFYDYYGPNAVQCGLKKIWDSIYKEFWKNA